MAAEAGVDIVDLAIESMSSMTSQPSMNAVVEALRGSKRDTGLDFEELDELSRYYGPVSYTHLDVYKRQRQILPTVQTYLRIRNMDPTLFL